LAVLLYPLNGFLFILPFVFFSQKSSILATYFFHDSLIKNHIKTQVNFVLDPIAPSGIKEALFN
jgi:hypothetical protein